MTKKLDPSERTTNDLSGLSVAQHRLYNIWCGMIHRCENPSRDGFEKYGARGISVCREWHDFESFVDWAIGNGYREDLTIDRINVNGNYEPCNCRWATPTEQANNKRNSRIIDIGGIRGTVKQWADLIGVSQYTLYDCLRNHDEEYVSRRIEDAIRTGSFKRYPEIDAVCVKCGSSFKVAANATKAKYCEKCKAIAKREKYRRYYQRKREKESFGAEVVSA